MDASRFDAWTRRRLGLAVGGGLASLAGLSLLGDAEARNKRKKKKKRCKKSLQPCGGKKKCCKEFTCGDTLTTQGNVCCKPLQGTCTEASECCGDFICDDISGLTGTRCCGVTDRACTVNQDCCLTFGCVAGQCMLVP